MQRNNFIVGVLGVATNATVNLRLILELKRIVGTSIT